MARKRNLWYCLFFLFVGGMLVRLAYAVVSTAISTVILIVGVLLILAAMVVFWFNFRE